MRRRQKYAYLSTWTGGLWIVGGTHSIGKVSITQREEGGDHIKSDLWKVTYDTCFFVGE